MFIYVSYLYPILPPARLPICSVPQDWWPPTHPSDRSFENPEVKSCSQKIWPKNMPRKRVACTQRSHAKPLVFFRFLGYMASRLGNSTIIKMSPRKLCKCGLCFKPSTVRIPTNLRDNPLLRTQTWNRVAFGSCIFVYLRVPWQLRCSLYLRCEGK